MKGCRSERGPAPKSDAASDKCTEKNACETTHRGGGVGGAWQQPSHTEGLKRLDHKQC
jgi:hypothetical protein